MDEKLIDQAILEVKKELLNANKKFKQFNSAHEGYAIILEELDEMWDEIKQNLISRSILECKQVAAMAIKYMVSMRMK